MSIPADRDLDGQGRKGKREAADRSFESMPGAAAGSRVRPEYPYPIAVQNKQQCPAEGKTGRYPTAANSSPYNEERPVLQTARRQWSPRRDSTQCTSSDALDEASE